MEFKVYTTDKRDLQIIADKHKLELDYLSENCGEGYVSNGKYLRVFCKHSHVDIMDSIVVLLGYEKEWEL